jgi:hypothetical protein
MRNCFAFQRDGRDFVLFFAGKLLTVRLGPVFCAINPARSATYARVFAIFPGHYEVSAEKRFRLRLSIRPRKRVEKCQFSIQRCWQRNRHLGDAASLQAALADATRDSKYAPSVETVSLDTASFSAFPSRLASDGRLQMQSKDSQRRRRNWRHSRANSQMNGKCRITSPATSSGRMQRRLPVCSRVRTQRPLLRYL